MSPRIGRQNHLLVHPSSPRPKTAPPLAAVLAESPTNYQSGCRGLPPVGQPLWALNRRSPSGHRTRSQGIFKKKGASFAKTPLFLEWGRHWSASEDLGAHVPHVLIRKAKLMCSLVVFRLNVVFRIKPYTPAMSESASRGRLLAWDSMDTADWDSICCRTNSVISRDTSTSEICDSAAWRLSA